MKYQDYYQTLGVNRTASQDEIKKAYRKLARQYHPDVSKEKNAEERFKEIGEAYDVLRDDEKRAAYDQLGPNWKQGQDFRPPPGWGDSAGFDGFSGFSSNASFTDFFESLFGQNTAQGTRQGFGGGFSSGFGGGGFGQSTRGQNQSAKILIDIEDSFEGATKTVSLKIPEQEGAYTVSRDRRLKVRIPKGIREGQKIRLGGQGSPGAGGGPAGDLQLEVSFRQHRWFRVEGADIYLDLPVTPWEAALGATIDVPVPGGRIGIKVPSGSEQGKKLRLRGRGLPGKEPGDFFVVVNLTLPKADSEDAQAFYERMRHELAYNPRQGF